MVKMATAEEAGIAEYRMLHNLFSIVDPASVDVGPHGPSTDPRSYDSSSVLCVLNNARWLGYPSVSNLEEASEELISLFPQGSLESKSL